MRIQLYSIIISCLVVLPKELPRPLLNKLKNEVGYESILLLRKNSQDCCNDLSQDSVTPIIISNANNSFNLVKQYNRRFLAVVCLNELWEDTLTVFFDYLQDMRETPSILLVDSEVNISAQLRYCFENKMLNVLCFNNNEYLYSSRAFPTFRPFKRRKDSVKHNFFIPQLQNLHGAAIRTIPNNIIPRTVIYLQNEQIHIGGYLMSFMESFAKRLNATIQINWGLKSKPCLNSMTNDSLMKQLINQDEVDIPMKLANMRSKESYLKSYALEISKWQLMLPTESTVDPSLLFYLAWDWRTIIMFLVVMLIFAWLLPNLCIKAKKNNFLFNLEDPMLRSMLNQAFKLPQRPPMKAIYIYALLFWSSFYWSIMYQANLSMLMVHPPQKTTIRNYEDLRRAQLKILLGKVDVDLMEQTIGRRVFLENFDVFKIVDTNTFLELRRQVNAAYSYPVTQNMWPLVDYKLAREQRARFRLSNDIVFLKFVLFTLPLPRNSIYLETLNQHIHQVHSSGLYNFWLHRTFNQLTAIGKISIEPIKLTTAGSHKSWQHYYYVWIMYIVCILISCIIFLVELTIRR
ncbi:Ir60b, partial [Drosophila busckii]